MDVLLLLFGPTRADLRACKVKRVSDFDCGSIAPRRSIRWTKLTRRLEIEWRSWWCALSIELSHCSGRSTFFRETSILCDSIFDGFILLVRT